MPTFFKKIALHSFYLILALLVSANLLWYFIPPRLFFARLVTLIAVLSLSLRVLAAPQAIYDDALAPGWAPGGQGPAERARIRGVVQPKEAGDGIL